MKSAAPAVADACACSRATSQHRPIDVEAAHARIDAAVAPVQHKELLPTTAARGRVLAVDVLARASVPSFDNSAMDGFALATTSLTGEGPWQLPVTGMVAAGQRSALPVVSNSATRIFTGAPLPPGADAVVTQESVVSFGDWLLVRERPAPGAHVRRIGEDMMPGQPVARSGARLSPRGVAAVVAAGHEVVDVRRPLRVVLVITGDEVSRLFPHRGGTAIADVNGPMLAAELERPDVELLERIAIGDNLPALEEVLASSRDRADLIVTTGGVSVGAADLVKPALIAIGGEILFEGVSIKPGKPVSFGRVAGAIWLGLPGNPVSAMVTWTLFGTRILDRLSGANKPQRRSRQAVAGQNLRHRPGRLEYRLARIDGFDPLGRDVVRCPEETHSARVAPLAAADGLVVIPAQTETILEGETIEFLPFGCC